MIYYNFYDFLQYFHHMNPTVQSSYQSHLSSPHNREDSASVDSLWKSMKSYEFPFDIEKDIDALKSEIIWSIYASLYYTTAEPMEYMKITQEYKKSDPAINTNYTSETDASIDSNISQKKSSLSSTFSSKTKEGQFNMSGQYIENNALIYFSSFWENTNGKIKVFNPSDFIKYILNYKHWPYYIDNCSGMDFYSYFKFIKDSFAFNTQNMKTDNTNNITDEDKFNTYFSSYIMEQLFYPEHFIRNIEIFIQSSKSYFNKPKEATREQAIFLALPLFHLPLYWTNKFSDKFYKTMISYIKNRKSVSCYLNFKNYYTLVIAYQFILYPFIQSLFSLTLYKSYGEDCNKIKEVLKEYIITHINEFDCYSSLKQKLDELNKIVYYNGVSIQETNDLKKGNASIRSFEINFSYNFFVRPHLSNFYRFNLINKVAFSVEQYLAYIIDSQLPQINTIYDSLSTVNYTNFQHKSTVNEQVKISPYMMP